ncbi:hypothetical protein JDV02_004816 [Purpureocillium takamizusanense]|uniref:Uncharacterized protein n=1 Tax=Purpureocillium takamizusanense TaxID=2060973 RepID=A0A9Q8QFD7_9HYPO|nr:uncharacterized protein JDV02_004816 [Purpureocillium takamizusanense]UNI18553.1 hypothetical protein JDV02_004816 [Purpureocillium takamizusanense]
MTEKTQTLAIDGHEHASFTPTKVLFINSSSGDFSDELQVLDLTSHTVRFPADSTHCAHDVELRPVSVWAKQETFVKDSVPYLWDMSMGRKSGVLYKTVGLDEKQRVPVAKFVAKNWFKNCCVLLLDEGRLDAVVTLATCVAVLNRDI